MKMDDAAATRKAELVEEASEWARKLCIRWNERQTGIDPPKL
jgi:hypothetical protein